MTKIEKLVACGVLLLIVTLVSTSPNGVDEVVKLFSTRPNGVDEAVKLFRGLFDIVGDGLPS